MITSFKQLDSMDCGPTCLRMVAKHYKKDISLHYLRDKTPIHKEGVNPFGMTEAALNLFRTRFQRRGKMRLNNYFLVLHLCYFLVACHDQPKKYEPVVSPEKISRDMMSWLYYNRDQMRWSANFKALDTNSAIMRKGDFLYRLTTGNYLPVRIKTADSSLCYKLYKFNRPVDKDIVETIKAKAQVAYRYLQYQGSLLPQFNFTDLSGTVYNPKTTEGKIVVINCWYIHCQACNEEMPELNRIVEKMKNRNDIVFIGLAFDKADSLKRFLARKEFKYAIVPDKENYLVNDLGIIYYPTHIIVNRKGEISKVIDGGINEFIDALNEELANVNQ